MYCPGVTDDGYSSDVMEFKFTVDKLEHRRKIWNSLDSQPCCHHIRICGFYIVCNYTGKVRYGKRGFV